MALIGLPIQVPLWHLRKCARRRHLRGRGSDVACRCHLSVLPSIENMNYLGLYRLLVKSWQLSK